MGAAFEIGFAKAHAPQPRGDGIDVGALAIVGGAGERDLVSTHGERVGGPGLQERKRLQRLDGRARIDCAIDVAPGGHHAPPGIHDGGGTPMGAFDHVASGELDEDGVGGGREGMVVGHGARNTLPWAVRLGKFRPMRGYFGIGVENLSKQMNAGSLFRTAHAFGASFVFTIAQA